MPPSKVRVSPDMYLKSGEPNRTHTRPIDVYKRQEPILFLAGDDLNGSAVIELSLIHISIEFLDKLIQHAF